MKASIALLFSLFFAIGAYANNYVIGFEGNGFEMFKAELNENEASLKTSGAEIRKILNNLEVIIVEAKNELFVFPDQFKSFKKVKYVDFVPDFPSPPKRHSAPYFVGFSQKQLVDYPWGILNVDAPAAWSMSRSGSGVKVVVLDTGIDRDHPNLANNFKRGKNFTSSNTSDLPYPYFDNIAHGTHVAGTIAANGRGAGVIGVAPSAEIYAGKVCDQGCGGVAIMEGLDWAIEVDADVVNMSLGGRFPSLSGEDIYRKMEDANIVVVAASGNDGENTISYPAAFSKVLSVGAIDRNQNVAEFSNFGPRLDIVAPGVGVKSTVPLGTGREPFLVMNNANVRTALESLAIDGSATGAFDKSKIIFAGLGRAEDIEGLDLNGNVALVERGELTFADKAKNVVAAGASAIIIFNNVPGELGATFGEQLDIVGLTLSQDVGQAIVEDLQNAEAADSFLISGGVEASNFAFLQGTSMATPHVAGIAALVRAANPNLDAAKVKELIIESALPASGDNSRNQFGNGMANALKAVENAIAN